MRHWKRWQAWLEGSESVAARWVRAGREALFGEMPILAAGTAMFALFAVIPVLAGAVAVYSVVADPTEINRHLAGLESVLPPQVVAFLAEQLARKAAATRGELGIALGVSIFLALFASRGAARALIDSLNRAYRVRERRSPLHKLLVTLAMAGGTLLGLMMMLVAVVALPAILALTGIGDFVEWLRWPVLMFVTFCMLLSLYRFAPSPRPLGTERRVWPGALFATVLLVLVSVGLSVWVESVAAYDLWYGAFGSVIVILLWFYLSVVSLVVGGFVNAELERHAGAPDPDRSMY